MITATLKMENGDKVKRELKAIGKGARNVVRRTMRKGGTYLLKKLRDAAPVATGATKKSLKVSFTKDGGAYIQINPAFTMKYQRLSNSKYVTKQKKFLESIRVKEKRPIKYAKRVESIHPWFYPTIETEQTATLNSLAENFWTELQKEKAKA